MSEESELDIRKALEMGTKRMTLKDLANRGFENVKVLDENQVQALIGQAVDRVISTQTEEERGKILSDSRRELDRLMREQKAARSRAELLEANKNELVERVEALQRELQLKSELEDEALHKKLQEGTASMQAQVEDLRQRHQAALGEATSLRSGLEEARREAARAKAQIPALETKAEEARREAARLQSQLPALEARAEEARRETAKSQSQVPALEAKAEEARREAAKAKAQLSAVEAKAEEARRDAAKAKAQIPALEAKTEEARALSARLSELQSTHEAALAELNELQREGERLAQDRDRVEKEAEASVSRVSDLEASLADTQSKHRGAEKARGDLVAQILELQSKVEALQLEVGSYRTDAVRQRSELTQLRQELEQARAARDRAGQDQKGLEGEIARLGEALSVERGRHAEQEKERARMASELGESRARLLAGEKTLRDSSSLADRLQVDNASLEQEVRRLRAEVQTLASQAGQERTSLTRQIEEIRAGHDTARHEAQKTGAERDRLHLEVVRLEHERNTARSELDRLQADRSKERERSEESEKALDELQSDVQALEEKLAQALQNLDVAQKAREELVGRGGALEEELDGARQETSFLKGQLAQWQKDHETQREKTVIVTAELAEIEAQQKQEQSELDGLREEATRLAQEEARLQKELAEARSEVQALQDLLRREQESAASAQGESVSLQARLLDLQTRSGQLDQELATLRGANDRLEERLANESDRARAAQSEANLTSRLDAQMALLDRLMGHARSTSSAAKASATRSETAAHTLDRALARQLRPKRKRRSGSLQGGAAYDGMALLDSFFRKIRLKEHFQKYVPIKEKVGPVHPSETLLEVLKADIGGEGKKERLERGIALEIVGPSDSPDTALLRQFLGRLSPQAIHAVGQVHDALRLHLNGLPRKPEPLVFDVHSPELVAGSSRARVRYRPLVSFEPGSEEFWGGRFRGSQEPELETRLLFLKTSIAKVPSTFARSRIRFRMDSGFFNEAVIRLLESKGCSYVIAAPDSRGLRKRARDCAYHRLSNGWEVGEFQERLHPIRKTIGRFVSVRRRLSRVAREAGPGLFHDDRHVYHVFATDLRATPFRSFEFYQDRAPSLARASELLADFTTSPLLGRSRRSRTALFHLHLLASDLIRWFKRSCLPEDQKLRGLDELRSDLFMVPPRAERPGTRSLVVLPKRDGRRRLFGRVTRKVRRIRPAAPFRLGR